MQLRSQLPQRQLFEKASRTTDIWETRSKVRYRNITAGFPESFAGSCVTSETSGSNFGRAYHFSRHQSLDADQPGSRNPRSHRISFGCSPTRRADLLPVAQLGVAAQLHKNSVHKDTARISGKEMRAMATWSVSEL